MDVADGQLDDEAAVAVITAAVMEILSKRKSGQNPVPQDPSGWRFSGRWWNEPITLGRSRPTLR
ncbi:MAG: hypothetical protein HKL84_02595 [Acidimicrobiaceae bacterium]|nr:hypothetical protein [Acidimicrobiaceae bacterium]